MNRYIIHDYQRPKIFSEYQMGDRIKMGNAHGFIQSWYVGNAVIIKWDIPRDVDRAYNIEELTRE